MKSPGKNWLLRMTAAIALALLVDASWATAGPPPTTGSRAAKHKTEEARTKHAAVAKHRKTPPMPSDDSLDGSEARDTLELALENYDTMLAVVANNIANAETPGFKRSRAIFEDLGYRQDGLPGVQDPSGAYSPNGFSIGSGSQIVGTEIDFRQGRLTRTGRELDLAIEGQGFFQVKDPSGSIYYSRAGHFSRNSTGQIVVASAKSGRILEPAISIPADATAISISPAGVVSYRVPGNQTLTQAGTIQLGTFINSQGLMTIGENLYQETEGSGTCETGSPGCNSFGKVRQGWIEKSNVDLRQEASEWKRIRRICRELRCLLEGP